MSPELDRAIREVVEAAAPDYRRAREHDHAWAVAWRAADAALLRGAGSLDLDALTYVLTPDGDPRLYVRTRVQVGGRSAFAMWFWIRDRGGEMTVEHRSAEPAKHMRIREYGGPFDLPLSRVGDVLGILDADGDGWAEIPRDRARLRGAQHHGLRVLAPGARTNRRQFSLGLLNAASSLRTGHGERFVRASGRCAGATSRRREPARAG